ncbi:MAG TPA: hypothetical protein VI753_14135 [Anaerolineales bacterium]|nr:hypothetical protein [Anaerolineales bacterium]
MNVDQLRRRVIARFFLGLLFLAAIAIVIGWVPGAMISLTLAYARNSVTFLMQVMCNNWRYII